MLCQEFWNQEVAAHPLAGGPEFAGEGGAARQAVRGDEFIEGGQEAVWGLGTPLRRAWTPGFSQSTGSFWPGSMRAHPQLVPEVCQNVSR